MGSVQDRPASVWSAEVAPACRTDACEIYTAESGAAPIQARKEHSSWSLRGGGRGEGTSIPRGLRFRAGIKGRIQSLKRDYGLRRCQFHGERWVGWGVMAHNLTKVAGRTGVSRGPEGSRILTGRLPYDQAERAQVT